MVSGLVSAMTNAQKKSKEIYYIANDNALFFGVAVSSSIARHGTGEVLGTG